MYIHCSTLNFNDGQNTFQFSSEIERNSTFSCELAWLMWLREKIVGANMILTQNPSPFIERHLSPRPHRIRSLPLSLSSLLSLLLMPLSFSLSFCNFLSTSISDDLLACNSHNGDPLDGSFDGDDIVDSASSAASWVQEHAQAPVVITRDPEPSHSPCILEVSCGSDVVASLHNLWIWRALI